MATPMPAGFLEFVSLLGLMGAIVGLFIGWVWFSGIRRRIYVFWKANLEYRVDVLVEAIRNGEKKYFDDFAKPIVSPKGIWRYQLLLMKELDGKTGKSLELKEEPSFIEVNGRKRMKVFLDADGELRHSTDRTIVHEVREIFIGSKEEIAKFQENVEKVQKELADWNLMSEEQKKMVPQPKLSEDTPKVYDIKERIENIEEITTVSTLGEPKNALGDRLNDYWNPRSPRYYNRLRDLLQNPLLWLIILGIIGIIGTILASQYAYTKNLEAQTKNMGAMAPMLAEAAAQAVMKVMLANQTMGIGAGASALNNAAKPADAGLGGLLNMPKVG